MTSRAELTSYLDTLIDIGSIPGDKSNNGLQVEGRPEVRTVIGAVDASLELYERATKAEADFIFVHHGESWGPGISYVTGTTAQRFRALLAHDISLYAAHLPLDAHRELGHNACIARALDLRETDWFAEYAGTKIGIHGRLSTPLMPEDLMALVSRKLAADCRLIDFHQQPIDSVGIIAGAGAGALAECRRLGIQCLITGEYDHTHYHPVRELGLTLIAAGHYKTEVPGIVAVLDAIRQRFDLRCDFVDVPTGL